MSENRKHRKKDSRVGLESLETKVLMTGNAGGTFAMVAGSLPSSGQVAEIPVSISNETVVMPKRSFVMGVDVVDQQGSNAASGISKIRTKDGQELPAVDPAAPVAANSSSTTATAATPESSAQLVRVNAPKRGEAVDLVVEAMTANPSGGAFITGFYLPGDVNGDGKVGTDDVNLIRSIDGAGINSSTYIFDADANRDGTIDQTDLSIAQMNLGVETKIQPMILVNLDPNSDSGPKDRVTANQTVNFLIKATPGTKVTLSEADNKFTPVTGVVAANGEFSLPVALALGSNQVKVDAACPFGQTFKGSLIPVIYDPNAAKDTPATTTTTDTTTPATTTSTGGAKGAGAKVAARQAANGANSQTRQTRSARPGGQAALLAQRNARLAKAHLGQNNATQIGARTQAKNVSAANTASTSNASTVSTAGKSSSTVPLSE